MMDFQTMKPKGFAYAEFEDRDSLVQALKMNGESLLNRSVRINVADQPKNKRSEPVFSSNWRQKPAEGGDRTFRDQFTKREPTSAFGGQGFSRDAGREYSKPAPVWGRKEGSNPFSKDGSAFAPKESESIAQRSSKPKVNPFGNAVAKDVHSIQQSILEKKEKQEPKKVETIARKEISSNQKDQQPKKPVDNVPTGSWRSRGPDTKKKESVFSQAKVSDKSREKNENSGDIFKVASKPETKTPVEKSKPAENRPVETAGKKSTNVYDLLENVLITNCSNEEHQVLR